jgi:hypothetical protein
MMVNKLKKMEAIVQALGKTIKKELFYFFFLFIRFSCNKLKKFTFMHFFINKKFKNFKNVNCYNDLLITLLKYLKFNKFE